MYFLEKRNVVFDSILRLVAFAHFVVDWQKAKSVEDKMLQRLQRNDKEVEEVVLNKMTHYFNLKAT